MTIYQNVNERSEKRDGPSKPRADLLSESRTDVVLQRLLDSVERNETEIKLLQNTQNAWLTKLSNDIDILRERFIDMEDQVATYKKKSETLDETLRIPGTPHMTVGEGIAANRRALAKTLNLVANKAESDDLSKLKAQLQSDVDQKFEKVHASTTLIEKLNQSIQALGSRTDVISLDVQNKVDKSLFSSLSSEAEIVRNHSLFVKETEKSIQEIHATMDKLTLDISEEKDLVKKVMNCTMELETSTNKLPTKEDLRLLKEDLSLSINQIESITSEGVLKLEQRQSLTEKQLTTLVKENQTLFAAHETLAKHISKRLDDTYKKKNIDLLLEKYLQVNSFLDAIQQIAHDVDSKATEQSLHELDLMVKKIAEDHELTRKKADLSARFIEWYTRIFNMEETPNS